MFQLAGEAQQQAILAEAGRELHADRQSFSLDPSGTDIAGPPATLNSGV